jgi:hypothetical protein
MLISFGYAELVQVRRAKVYWTSEIEFAVR